jgi:molybdate transport system substrate-binding protein
MQKRCWTALPHSIYWCRYSATATPVNGRNRLVAALEDREIDLFVYYCSGAKYLVSASPGLKSVGLPPQLSIGPEYGLTVSRKAAPEAAAFAAYLLSPGGQSQLKAFGFIPANPAD